MPSKHIGSREFLAAAPVRLAAVFGIKPDEISLALLSFAYFFLLLCGYFIIRPIRDQLSIAQGTTQLQNLLGLTFLAMLGAVPLYGWVVSRFPKGLIVPITYGCFAMQILIFCILQWYAIRPALIAPYFYVWVSVYNLFIVSIFWSYMVDVFDADQAERLFGFIAAGGTIGSLAATPIVNYVPYDLLLPLSLTFLLAALACVLIINRILRRMPGSMQDQRIGHSPLSGFRSIFSSRYLLAIATWVLLSDVLDTFLYMEQQDIVRRTILSGDQQRYLFSDMNFAVGVVSVLLQVFLTAVLIRRFGVGWAMAAQPIVAMLCFIALAFAPVLSVIVVSQVVTRGVEFGIANPSRHCLFSVVGLDEKYKALNVTDTLVERAGDALGSQSFAWIEATAGLGHTAAIAVPITVVWLALSLRLGQMWEKLLA